MRFLLLAGVVALAGCSTYEQRVAGHCARLGAGPGTSQYWPCVERTELLDQRNREMWSTTAVAGAGMLTPAPSYYVVPRSW